MEVEGDAKITCSDTGETLEIGNYSTKMTQRKIAFTVQKDEVRTGIAEMVDPSLIKCLCDVA